LQRRFVYDQNVLVKRQTDVAVSQVASAIGEPARARILLCLMDGHARTSTELAVVAEVSPSTTSVHLNRLRSEHLITVQHQGKHHLYRLAGPDVASALEGLSVLAGGFRDRPTRTPIRLRAARTCYDHLAGTLGVSLHDRFVALGWIAAARTNSGSTYDLTAHGTKAFEALGIDLEETRKLRRRFASACLDWSERRPHIGGALGAAVLRVALKRKWVVRDLDSRALFVTRIGRSELLNRFGVEI
jgi:DNA-binding transcriptional ArsR family regulator